MIREPESLNLPKGWIRTTLEEVAYINPKPDTEQLPENLDVTFLPMKCVDELTGQIDLSHIRKLSEVRKGYTYFSDGDVLFAKITPCMENGKIAIANDLKNSVGFGSTEFHVIRFYKDISRKLFFYFLIREDLRSDARRKMTGSAGQLRVPTNYMLELPILLPPLPEQHRIVSKIEELFTKLDAGVDALKKVKVELKRYRQSVLKHAFEGKLTAEWREANKGQIEPASVLLDRIKEERKKALGKKYKELPPVDKADFPELPKEWVWTKLEDIREEVEKVSPQDNADKEFFYLDIASIDNRRQEVTEPKKYLGSNAPSRARQLVKEGDILFSTVRTYLKNIAKVKQFYDGQIASTGF